ncbi:hypothetical protein [uncultured Fusobacterium sp.]|uniref:DNA polymerase III subunit delta n=1 Tax=uncultured Fusobacterium sp. TaxID=159267 RepID=UPI002594B05E|nr:hypothetical protein [uncultured Fusobacterium sp.]
MLYLLYGDTTPLQIKYEELLSELKGNHPGIKEIIYDASLNEITEFFDSVSTNSMFSPYQLIVLKRAEDYKNLADLAKSLEMYNLAQKDIIIIYEEFLNDFGKRTNEISKKVLTAFGKIAEIICFRKENEKKASVFYLQKNLNISQNEAETLLELIGDDYFKLKNEVEKIKNFLDGDLFNMDKIIPILSINKEANLKKLTESFILTQQTKELLNFLRDEKTYPNFIYIITDELLIYLKLILLIDSSMLDRNVSYNKFKDHVFEEIKKYFVGDRGNIHSYYLFLKLKNVNLFNKDFLVKKLNELLLLEYQVKSGELDLDIEVETFILNFYSN